jgi:hypothetical protein
MRGQMDEWPPKVGFAGDSPLEEAGFELPKIEASHAVIVLASMHMKSQSGSIRNLPGVMAPDQPLR